MAMSVSPGGRAVWRSLGLTCDLVLRGNTRLLPLFASALMPAESAHRFQEEFFAIPLGRQDTKLPEIRRKERARSYADRARTAAEGNRSGNLASG
jgi:hypothetical protein